MAHARLESVDVADARVGARGHRRAHRSSEVELAPTVAAASGDGPAMAGRRRGAVRGRTDRRHRQREPYQGADAADLVIVDYEPLQVLVDPEEALASDMLLFPDAGTNVAAEMQLSARRQPTCSTGATSS